MRRGSWGLLILICSYCSLAGASLGKIIPVLPSITESFGITEIQASWLLSAVAATAVLAAPAGGWFGDRFGDRKLLLFSLVIGLAGTVLSALSTSYSSLMIGRAIEGIAFNGLLTGAMANMIRSFQGARRAVGLAVFGAAIPMGIGLAEAMAGFVDRQHWQLVFWGHAVFLAAGLAAVALLPPYEALTRQTHQKVSMFVIYREVKALRLALGLGILTLSQFGVSALFPTYLQGTFAVSPSSAATFGALTLLIAIVGNVGAGIMLGRGAKPATLGTTTFLVCALSGAVIFFADLGVAGAVAASLIFALAGGFANGILVALLPKLVSNPALTSRASGLLAQMVNTGILLAPPVTFSVYFAFGGSGMLLLLVLCSLASLCIVPFAASDRLQSDRLVEKAARTN